MFIETTWGEEKKLTFKMSKRGVVRGALRLLMGQGAPGHSEQERAAWRATVKRGLRKMMDELA